MTNVIGEGSKLRCTQKLVNGALVFEPGREYEVKRVIYNCIEIYNDAADNFVILSPDTCGKYFDVTHHTVKQVNAALALTDLTGHMAQDERKAFELRMEAEGGAGATELWLKDNPQAGYKNTRVNDYRFGWVMCLDWMADRVPQGGIDAPEIVGYTYDFYSGAYSQYPGENWSPMMTVAQHERIVAALAPVQQPEEATTSLAEAVQESIKRTKPESSLERWEPLRLAAEVAQEDGPWDPRIGLTNCEKAFATSAGPQTVLELIGALHTAIAEIGQLRKEREGKTLVPNEPNIKMIAILGFGGDVDLAVGHGAICKTLEDTYQAMLAAAQCDEN